MLCEGKRHPRLAHFVVADNCTRDRFRFVAFSGSLWSSVIYQALSTSMHVFFINLFNYLYSSSS